MSQETFQLLVGVDLASVADHQVCVMDLGGKLVGERTVGHSGDELRRFFDWLAGLGHKPSEVAIGVESPGNTLVDGAMDRGFCVFHTNPKKIDRFRERESVAGAKDDRRDARVIAHALRTDLRCFERLDIGDPRVAALRELIRERAMLIEQCGMVANRLRDQLQRYYPAALELCGAANERWFWRVIALAPSPKEAKRLSRARVAKVLKDCRIRKLDAQTVVTKLRETAPVVQSAIVATCSSRVRRLIKQIGPVHDLITEVEREVQTALNTLAQSSSEGLEDPSSKGRHRDAAILLSMPGVGTIVGATVLAEAATAIEKRDYHRFRALTGIAPVTKRSGKGRGGAKGRGRVSMRYACSNPLRVALHHMARVAVRHDAAATAHYKRLRAGGASYGRALRGVADRLARILFAALRSGQLYQPARLQGVYATAA